MWAADSPGPHHNRQEVRPARWVVAVRHRLAWGNQAHISEPRVPHPGECGLSDRHDPLNLEMCARHPNGDRSQIGGTG
jgi:hypothetical protein